MLDIIELTVDLIGVLERIAVRVFVDLFPHSPVYGHQSLAKVDEIVRLIDRLQS